MLRETLKRTGRIGIARVVIRTREYLSAVMPRDDALMLMLLRYPQELVDAEEYKIPQGTVSSYRISPKEITMAEQLIESMCDQWKPGDYRDEFRDRLHKVIEKRLKSKGVVTPPEDDDAVTPENASTNVVDFMALLQKSLASNRRTSAKKTAAKKTVSEKAGKSVSEKSGAKPIASTKKKSTRKAARKSSPREVG